MNLEIKFMSPASILTVAIVKDFGVKRTKKVAALMSLIALFPFRKANS
ncbi:MAG: hypothetical protein IBX69_14590 [Anaerolineales bacterium]|nr:hypothetical protein [Anaerolineales bacterium]